MLFSPHSLHAPVIQSDVHKNEVRLKLQVFADDETSSWQGQLRECQFRQSSYLLRPFHF